jgi:hypothetical protein
MEKRRDVNNDPSHSSHETSGDALQQLAKSKHESKHVQFIDEFSKDTIGEYKTIAYGNIVDKYFEKKARKSPYGDKHMRKVRNELKKHSGMRQGEIEYSNPQEREYTQVKYEERKRLQEENWKRLEEKRN